MTQSRARPVARPLPRAPLSRLTRYILSEVTPLLVAGLTVVVLLFLLAAIYAVIAPLLAKGAAPLLVARLAAYSIPEGISRGLPIALLFAVLLALSRLASDAEIKSMLAAGLSPTRLMWPVLGLAGVVAALSFLNAETLVPRAAQRTLTTGREILLDNPRVLGLGEAGTVLKDAFGRAITVDRVLTGGRFEGVRVVQTQSGGPAREVITAAQGRLLPGTSVLQLSHGTRTTFQNARPITISDFQSVNLPVQDLQANLNTDEGQAKPVTYPLPELLSRIRTLRATGADASAELTALHRKFAEPLAALAFAFFGVALALFTFRTGGSLGLVWVLLLTFAYYATWSVFRVMGEQGAIAPALAAWAPDFLYLVAGAALLFGNLPQFVLSWAQPRPQPQPAREPAAQPAVRSTQEREQEREAEAQRLLALQAYEQLSARTDALLGEYAHYRHLTGEAGKQLERLTGVLRERRRRGLLSEEARAQYEDLLRQAEALLVTTRVEHEAARALTSTLDPREVDALLDFTLRDHTRPTLDPGQIDALLDEALRDPAQPALDVDKLKALIASTLQGHSHPALVAKELKALLDASLQGVSGPALDMNELSALLDYTLRDHTKPILSAGELHTLIDATLRDHGQPAENLDPGTQGASTEGASTERASTERSSTQDEDDTGNGKS